MQLGVSRRDPVHAFRYGRYDAWISPLESLRDEVLGKTWMRPGKVRVIPLGIDAALAGGTDVPGSVDAGPSRVDARNFFGIPAGGTLFGIIGRIEPGKGQGFLLKAVKRLRDGGHDARLLDVGTVGPSSKVTADVVAREIVVYGTVKGNLRARDRIEIKEDGSVVGDLTTARIMIEDGAYFKGSIEIDRGGEKDVDLDKPAFSRVATGGKSTAAD